MGFGSREDPDVSCLYVLLTDPTTPQIKSSIPHLAELHSASNMPCFGPYRCLPQAVTSSLRGQRHPWGCLPFAVV